MLKGSRQGDKRLKTLPIPRKIISNYKNIRRTDAESLRKLRRNKLNWAFSFSEFDVCAQ
jgi:hypothetical protein